MKNRKMKRMLAAVLAATLTVGCLTACGDQPANNQGSETKEPVASSESSEKQETIVPEVPKEPVKITYVPYVTSANVWDDEQLVEDAINEYIEPLIGVSIEIKKPEEIGNDVTLALASGEDVDLFWASSSLYGPELMANEGALDVTDIVKEYPDIYNLLPENIWTASTYQGRNYYIPIPKESATGYGRYVAKQFVDKYGWDLSTVKEWKDLEPMLADLKKEGVDYPFLNHTATYNLFGIDEFAFVKDYAGVKRDGDTTKIVSIYETDEYKEFLDMKYSWNQAGYINQAEIDRLKSATISELRENLEIGFYPWTSVPDVAGSVAGKNAYEVEVLQITENYIDTDSAFGSSYMINAAADDETIEACMKFINALFTDEKLANLLAYGIEGKHYELVDGRVSILADSKYKTAGVWALTAFNAPTLMVGEAENKEELYKEFNEAGILSCTAGFSFDQSKVDAEIAACDAVLSEYRLLLEKGFYNPDEYLPIMVDALKNAGMEKVIAEIQTQYDAWLASK